MLDSRIAFARNKRDSTDERPDAPSVLGQSSPMNALETNRYTEAAFLRRERSCSSRPVRAHAHPSDTAPTVHSMAASAHWPNLRFAGGPILTPPNSALIIIDDR